MVGRNSSGLPPGFRFHPTDEELIMYYLQNQATSRPCPVSIIPEVDIYKFDPWELPEKSEFGENEWYFFTPRDRKYPNGVRPNRAAVSGYWKATGTDKAIYSGSKYVGVKKALVFYKGRPPKGIKTDWIMHEYRLNESRSRVPYNQSGSMRLDDWVLCRIYKKKNLGKTYTHDQQRVVQDSFAQIVTNDHASEPQPPKFPRTCSLTHLWEFDNMSSISQLLLNDTSSYTFPFNNTNQATTTTNNDTFSGGRGSNGGGGAADKHQLGHLQQPSRKSQVNQTIFVNPVYETQ